MPIQSPDTETEDYGPIKVWCLGDADNDGNIIRCEIWFHDPLTHCLAKVDYEALDAYFHQDPAHENMNWSDVIFRANEFKKNLEDYAKEKKENPPKTWEWGINSRILENLKPDSYDWGIINASVNVKRDKESQKIIKSDPSEFPFPEINWREYLFWIEPDSYTKKGKVWIYDRVLDKLLKKDIQNVTIYVGDIGPLWFYTYDFVEYGKKVGKKIYIDTKTLPSNINDERLCAKLRE
jgi:hypothetical protein